MPRSGVLLELIRSGLQAHKAELITQMDACLTDDARALLDDLFTTPDDQNRYRLTLLKKLSQSTKPLRIKEAVADYETLAALHDTLHGTLTALNRDCPFAFRSLSLRPMGGKIKLGPARTAFRDGLVEGESRGDCAPDCKPVRYCRRPVTPLPSPRRRSLEVAMITVMPAPQLPAARAGR